MLRPDISHLPLDVQANVVLIEAIAAATSLTVRASHDAREVATQRPQPADLPIPRRLERIPA